MQGVRGVKLSFRAIVCATKSAYTLGGGLWVAVGVALTVTLSGCSPASNGAFDSESVLVASCSVAQDQRGTFMAKVAGFPLHIQAESSFTAEERQGIENSVAQWNTLGRKIAGHDFFELRFVALRAAVHTDDPRDCSLETFGDSAVFSIVRETSNDRWSKLSFSDSIPGATLRCYSGTVVQHQVVMIYIGIVDSLQLSSVIVHELGHTLGLDHSCFNGASTEKFVSCNGLAETHPYHQAVMFPSLRSRRSSFERPEIKDFVRDNDEERTSCLYHP